MLAPENHAGKPCRFTVPRKKWSTPSPRTCAARNVPTSAAPRLPGRQHQLIWDFSVRIDNPRLRITVENRANSSRGFRISGAKRDSLMCWANFSGVTRACSRAVVACCSSSVLAESRQNAQSTSCRDRLARRRPETDRMHCSARFTYQRTAVGLAPCLITRFR